MEDELRVTLEDAFNPHKKVTPQLVSEEEKLAYQVVEIGVTLLDPGPSDWVIFYLPEGATKGQAVQLQQSLHAIIQGAFKFMVMVKGQTDISLIRGSEILLPGG